MAQFNLMTQGGPSTTIMETSDSDDSVEEVPLTLVQPKISNPISAKQKNGGKGRGKKKATKESNEDFELVGDSPDSGNNEVTNKCKIGKNMKILILT